MNCRIACGLAGQSSQRRRRSEPSALLRICQYDEMDRLRFLTKLDLRPRNTALSREKGFSILNNLLAILAEFSEDGTMLASPTATSPISRRWLASRK